MSYVNLQSDKVKMENNFADLKLYDKLESKAMKDNEMTVGYESSFSKNSNHNEKNEQFTNDSEIPSDDENDMEDLIKNILCQKYENTGSVKEKKDQSIGSSIESKNNDTVVQVNEDDIVDKRQILMEQFQVNLVNKYEFRFEPRIGVFKPKYVSFSKSLQRKLVSFHTLLDQHQMHQQTFQTSAGDEFKFNPKKFTVENLNKLIAASNATSNTDPGNVLKSQEFISFIFQNSIQNQEFKKKLFRCMRSIAERVLIDALTVLEQYYAQIQQHKQNKSAGFLTQNLGNSSSVYSNSSSKLWLEIRKSGCQFLGPQMQDDVLKLILHGLNTVTRMARKTLVLYVVHMLKKHYPKASKTSVGHVVQLLYKAGCFIVHKREGSASLMELKKEYTKYTALRRLHDTQIIHIALMADIRISPEIWSQKLFGDSNHKSEMQSIIDKLQSQQTLENLVFDFYTKASLKMPECDGFTNMDQVFHDKQDISKMNELDKINMIFLQIKEDFEFIASINFEKKKQSSPSMFGQLSNSSLSGSPQTGEYSSNDSEDEIESYFNDVVDEDEDFDSLSNSTEPRSKPKIEQEQTKIVWSLLNECLKRVIKILTAHIEYISNISILMDMNSSEQFNSLEIGYPGTHKINNHQKKNGYQNKKYDDSNYQVNQLGNYQVKKDQFSRDPRNDLLPMSSVSPFPHDSSNLKKKFNFDYQSNLDMNGQYVLNIASQPFVPISYQNNYYNTMNSTQFINPMTQMSPFLDDRSNSLFYDQNNNNNKNNYQLNSSQSRFQIIENLNGNFQNKSNEKLSSKMHKFNQTYYQTPNQRKY